MGQDYKKNKWAIYETIKGNHFLNNDGSRLLEDDCFLIDKCLRGTELEQSLAWNAINYFYGNKVFQQLRSKCNTEDAYDITQEAMLYLSQNLSRIRSSILGILVSAANGIRVDKYRQSQKSGIRLEEKEDFSTMAQDDDDDDDGLVDLNKSIMKLVNKFLRSLSDKERVTFKVMHLIVWDLDEQAKELRCIAQNSDDEKDNVREVLDRIYKVLSPLKEEENEIIERDAKITELSFRILRLEEESTEEHDRTENKSNEKTNLQKRREKLLKEKNEENPVITTKRKDISFILGEPLGTITARVSHLKKRIAEFIEENEDILASVLSKKGCE